MSSSLPPSVRGGRGGEALPFVLGVQGRDMANGQRPRRLGEAARAKGAAMAGPHLFGPDAMVAEPTQGAQQKAGSAVLARVVRHPDRGEPGRSLHRDMHEVPARAVVATSDPPAGDAVAGLTEAVRPLDFKADERARGHADSGAPALAGRSGAGDTALQS